jgi:hypothetical protein
VEQQEKLREGINDRPGARRTLLERSIDAYHSLLSVVNRQMIWMSSVRDHVVFEGRRASPRDATVVRRRTGSPPQKLEHLAVRVELSSRQASHMPALFFGLV